MGSHARDDVAERAAGNRYVLAWSAVYRERARLTANRDEVEMDCFSRTEAAAARIVVIYYFRSHVRMFGRRKERHVFNRHVPRAAEIQEVVDVSLARQIGNLDVLPVPKMHDVGHLRAVGGVQVPDASGNCHVLDLRMPTVLACFVHRALLAICVEVLGAQKSDDRRIHRDDFRVRIQVQRRIRINHQRLAYLVCPSRNVHDDGAGLRRLLECVAERNPIVIHAVSLRAEVAHVHRRRRAPQRNNYGCCRHRQFLCRFHNPISPSFG